MTERGEQNKLTRHDEHLPERRSECGSGSHKGSRKNTTRRCGDFFQAACLPLGLCFCEQSGGMTKTALPIRFKPAWAGHSNKFIPLKLKIPHIPKMGIWGNRKDNLVLQQKTK